jgi:hypothetical protein
MFRYKLRTLLIVLALGPPVLAAYLQYTRLWDPIHEAGVLIAVWAVLMGFVWTVRNLGA